MNVNMFCLITAEYGDLQSNFPYSVQMCENMDQENSQYEPFSRSGLFWYFPWQIFILAFISGTYSF